MNIKKMPGLLAILQAGVLAVSLFRNDLFTEAYIVPKYYYFAFLLLPIVLLSLYSCWKVAEKKVLNISYLDILVSGFYVYQFIRLLFTPNEPLVHADIINQTLLLFLYWSVRLIVKDYTAKELKTYTHYWFLSLLILLITNSLYGLLQLSEALPPAHPLFKVGGSFGNPGPYSNFVVSLLPLVYMGLLYRYQMSKKMRSLLVVAFILTMIILPFTMARTAWLGALSGLIVSLYFYYKETEKGRILFSKVYVKVGFIALTLAVITSGIIFSYGMKRASASGRLFIWQRCGELIKEKPIVGSGFDSFCYVFNDAQANYFSKASEDNEYIQLADNGKYAFNEFIQTTVETGIIGLLLLVGIFCLALVGKKKSGVNEVNEKNLLVVTAKVILFTIGFCCFFSYPLHTLPVQALFFISLAIISANTESTKSFHITLLPQHIKIITACIVLLSGFIYLQLINRYNGEKEWGQLIKAKNQMTSESLNAEYKKLEPVLDYNKYFLYNYGAEMIVTGDFKKATEVLERAVLRLNDSNIYIYLGIGYKDMKQYDEAERCFQKASDVVPSKLYPLYNLVKLYDITGRKNEAKELALRIVRMGEKTETEIGKKVLLEMNNYLKQIK